MIKEIEFYYKDNKCDRKKEVEKLLNYEDENFVYSPAKICRQNTLVYVAMKKENKETKEKTIFAKIFTTSTSRYNNKIQIDEFDETQNPEYTTCPSSILKKLSDTDNENALLWREACKEHLECLAIEKLDKTSLVNLPVNSVIQLYKNDADGNPITLIKDNMFNFSKPVWVDTETYEKYKMCDIQDIGYQIVKQS